MDMIERAARAAEIELGKQEMVLADPITLRRMMAKRIARAVLIAIREPSITMHNAGAFSEGQSKPATIKVCEESGALFLHGYSPANPSKIWEAMFDAALNPPAQKE